jgi:transposase
MEMPLSEKYCKEVAFFCIGFFIKTGLLGARAKQKTAMITATKLKAIKKSHLYFQKNNSLLNGINPVVFQGLLYHC